MTTSTLNTRPACQRARMEGKQPISQQSQRGHICMHAMVKTQENQGKQHKRAPISAKGGEIMDKFQSLIADLDTDERESLQGFIGHVQVVEGMLTELEGEPVKLPDGRLNPAVRAYKDLFSLYVRAVSMLENHVRTNKHQRKLLELKYGEGGKLSPLEQWLEGLEDDEKAEI